MTVLSYTIFLKSFINGRLKKAWLSNWRTTQFML